MTKCISADLGACLRERSCLDITMTPKCLKMAYFSIYRSFKTFGTYAIDLAPPNVVYRNTLLQVVILLLLQLTYINRIRKRKRDENPHLNTMVSVLIGQKILQRMIRAYRMN